MPQKGLYLGVKKGLGKGTNSGLNTGGLLGLTSNTIYLFQEETSLWLAQLPLPKPSTNYVLRIDFLIKRLKELNIWQKLDRLWIFASEQRSHAPISLVNPKGSNNAWPTNLTEVSSPSWVRLKGYTGNGSSSYLNSNYNPSNNAVNYALNSGSLGVYTIGTESNRYGTPIGGYSESDSIEYWIRLTTPVWSPSLMEYYYAWNINDPTQDILTLGASQSPVTGLFATSRTNSSSTAFYLNGSQIATGTTTSNGLPDFNVPIMAADFNGSMTDFSSNTYSMAFIGSGLGIPGMNRLYNYFQVFAMQNGFYVV